MTILPRNYGDRTGQMTAAGILRFACNPTLYRRMKNQEAIAECEKKGLCNSCRTEKRKPGMTKCAECLAIDAARKAEGRK